MKPTIGDIIAAIRSAAPDSYQESWDNTGVIIGDTSVECTGALLCVDVTEAIVDEAVGRGCNLIVSHHPLIFKGIKRFDPSDRVAATAMASIRAGVTIFACHTSIDRTPEVGVSYTMARMLGLTGVTTLDPEPGSDIGLGVVGDLAEPMSAIDFVERVKSAFQSPVARCSVAPDRPIRRVALCGGSGGEFIPVAIAAGADAYVNSDTRYHDFVDYGQRILLVDIGHYESENCTKQIFYDLITKKFRNFAVYFSNTEFNPISYL